MVSTDGLKPDGVFCWARGNMHALQNMHNFTLNLVPPEQPISRPLGKPLIKVTFMSCNWYPGQCQSLAEVSDALTLIRLECAAVILYYLFCAGTH